MYSILDNNGETFDRFTIVDHETGAVYGASCNPYAPNGFGQFCGDIPVRKGEAISSAVERYLKDAEHIGRPIAIADVPPKVLQYAEQMCNRSDVLTF